MLVCLLCLASVAADQILAPKLGFTRRASSSTYGLASQEQLYAILPQKDAAQPFTQVWQTLGTYTKLILITLSRYALIDFHIRGRDQRRPWVLALANVHPAWRLMLCASAVFVALLPWLLRELLSDEQCRSIQLLTIYLCGALVKAGAALALCIAIVASVLLALSRAALEEMKDDGLTEELYAAACASAAYQRTPAERLTELHARGVESRNWRVDKQLSTETVAIFFNWYSQAVWVAFRGTWSLEVRPLSLCLLSLVLCVMLTLWAALARPRRTGPLTWQV